MTGMTGIDGVDGANSRRFIISNSLVPMASGTIAPVDSVGGGNPSGPPADELYFNPNQAGNSFDMFGNDITAWQNRDKDLPLKSYNDALILASLIEKEASLNYEKSLVAEVFLNRLKLNMKLQSDPTVLYGIEQQSGLKKKELKKKDLKHESKFNTYLNHGLPIGPICNPGKDSIIAATNPSKGDLLYFVANGDGGHNFSTNYKSHLKNVEKFKKFVNENKK